MNATRPCLQRASGESRVVFAVRDGATRLADLYQCDPCRVLFPDPEPGEPPQAVLVTTSGGVTDGDSLTMAIEVGPPLMPSAVGKPAYAAIGAWHGQIMTAIARLSGKSWEFGAQEAE